MRSEPADGGGTDSFFRVRRRRAPPGSSPGTLIADPEAQRPVVRVIVRARKGVAGPLCLHPGMSLHGPDGGFTVAAETILRGAAALRF